MSRIINLNEIKIALESIDVIAAIEHGFISYSRGYSVVPPVGELLFENPPGDVHIKYGYIKNDAYYVIKIASGFYENQKLGIPSGQGLMLLFKQETGELLAVLLDEGHLTDVRTAAAGALCAKHFSPKKISGVGIIGTGVQAKLQLKFLQKHTPCKKVYLWGRDEYKAQKMKEFMGDEYDITIVSSCSEVAKNSNLIITTTPSESTLLMAQDVRKGTLIIAVGSDTHSKQELESELMTKADIVIADSLSQSESRGEIYRAVLDKAISRDKIVELGTAIQYQSLGRLNDDKIAVIDLTGVAVQDIMIASAVYSQLCK